MRVGTPDACIDPVGLEEKAALLRNENAHVNVYGKQYIDNELRKMGFKTEGLMGVGFLEEEIRRAKARQLELDRAKQQRHQQISELQEAQIAKVTADEQERNRQELASKTRRRGSVTEIVNQPKPAPQTPKPDPTQEIAQIEKGLKEAEENKRRIAVMEAKRQAVNYNSPASSYGSPMKSSPAQSSPGGRGAKKSSRPAGGSNFIDSWKARSATVARDDYGTFEDGRRTRKPDESRSIAQARLGSPSPAPMGGSPVPRSQGSSMQRPRSQHRHRGNSQRYP